MNTETLLLMSRKGDAYRARGDYGLGAALCFRSERLWNCEQPRAKSLLHGALNDSLRLATLLITELMRPARAR